MTATVVLVHGAWHGAWCWDAVTEQLDTRGIPNVAIDLPGPDLQLLPNVHGTDGFYAAVLERTA